MRKDLKEATRNLSQIVCGYISETNGLWAGCLTKEAAASRRVKKEYCDQCNAILLAVRLYRKKDRIEKKIRADNAAPRPR